MNKRMTALAATLCFGTSIAYADDSTFDPRSLAMGGTGVATSNTRNAAFQDPAMLASNPRDSFALELPIVSARLQDEAQLQSDVNSLKTSSSNLTAAIQAFQANQTLQNAGAAATALNNFNNSLQPMDHKALMADLFGGAMVGVPSKNVAWALYVDAHAEAGAMFAYSANDQATLTNLANALQTCSTSGSTTSAACATAATTVNASTTNGQVNALQSQLLVRGVFIKELGISAAHRFEGLGDLDIGITPKAQQIKTYDFAVSAQQPTLSLNQGEKGYSAFNMDLGVVKAFKQDSGDEFKAGLVVKNIMSKSFTTILGDHIDIKPQATLGAAYVTPLTTTGVDVDVIPNKPIISGFSKESQYVRLGAEFDAWRWAQVRLGVRHDLKGNCPNLPSIGLGFSPFGVHIDLSVAAAGQKERAASLQLGFNF